MPSGSTVERKNMSREPMKAASSGPIASLTQPVSRRSASLTVLNSSCSARCASK